MSDLPTRLRDSLCGLDESRAKLALEAADEIERLQAIVDTLPKCWGLTDGVLVKDVPVVPGMDVWVSGAGASGSELWMIEVTAIDDEGYVSGNIGGRPRCWHVDKCANTREAAA